MIGFLPELQAVAARLGFSLCGVAPATEADTFAGFERWLEAGYAGQMNYLAKHRDARRHPHSILQEVKSVVMLGLEYGGESGNVARYAQGPDYHDVIWQQLDELAAWLEAQFPGCATRGVVDTAPLLERDFARRAGLGWFGKNTMLINQARGSYFFLAALLTSQELPATPPQTTSHCGTCTACLDSCPTQAFPEPGVLDATRCISYLTIELRGPIPEHQRSGIGHWLFGCDVCQEVCPWNRKGGTDSTARSSNPELVQLDAVELLQMSETQLKEKFRRTALWRTKRQGLLRNAAIVLGNTGDARALLVLQQVLNDADEVIRDAARWAIEQIQQRQHHESPGTIGPGL